LYARCGAGEKLEITSKAYLSLSGGSTMPSNEDKNMTQRLVDIFHPLEIRIYDHIIVADTKYTSMAEKGYMPSSAQAGANYEPFEIVEATKEEEIIYSMDIEDEELELE